jgi:hypothetical protein
MKTVSVKIENLDINIIIEEEDGKFFGTWKCECGLKGGSSKACNDEEIAIIAAKSNATSHVGAEHKDRSK